MDPLQIARANRPWRCAVSRRRSLYAGGSVLLSPPWALAINRLLSRENCPLSSQPTLSENLQPRWRLLCFRLNDWSISAFRTRRKELSAYNAASIGCVTGLVPGDMRPESGKRLRPRSAHSYSSIIHQISRGRHRAVLQTGKGAENCRGNSSSLHRRTRCSLRCSRGAGCRPGRRLRPSSSPRCTVRWPKAARRDTCPISSAGRDRPFGPGLAAELSGEHPFTGEQIVDAMPIRPRPRTREDEGIIGTCEQ